MISIFTDGSSRGNPGPGGFGAIIRTDKEVVELGGRSDHTTNNRMELCAAINALSHVVKTKAKENIVVQTDSKYLINGITTWVVGWQNNGWKTAARRDVENRDLWEVLFSVCSGLSIDWKYVEGHAGHPGNERCDEIATSFADGAPLDLYRGSRKSYPIDLDAMPIASGAMRKSSSAKAYSYISLVDGVVETHKTWMECEARVKGVTGAKFKKVVSLEDEKELIKRWTK